MIVHDRRSAHILRAASLIAIAAAFVALSVSALAPASASASARFTVSTAVVPGRTAAGENPFPLLFPELKRLPAPNWLKEATRMTYRFESATIAQKEDAKGSTGAGLMQYDLVALDEDLALTSVKFYADTVDGRSVVPSLVTSGRGIPSAGDTWINPSVLKDAERAASDKMKVARMPYKTGNATYQAVRFQYEDKGVLYVWMFEAKTGLLLFYRHALGSETDATRQLSSLTLVSRRQLKLPWRNGSRPAWARIGTRLNYEGEYNVLIPDTPATGLPYTSRALVRRTGGDWCLVQLTAAVAGRADVDVERATGAAQLFDGLWLAPEALKALSGKKGVIDRDPATGARISVSHARGGITELTETGAAYRSTLSYDRSGALIAIDQEIQNGIMATRVELKLTSRK